MMQVVSISFELIVALLGVLIALKKKKSWGWGITLTFAVYVYYDLANLFEFSVSQALLRSLFFIASLSILWSVYRIYREV